MDFRLRYKVDISYDGTDFIGWQIQPNGRSIQGVLEDALSIVLRSKTRILGASRTDSGVHADQQIASFTTTATIDLRALKTSLNALLPGSIRVNEVVEVEDAFHPIASAVQKVYCYRIWNERKPPPKDRLYVWALGQDLDVDNMAQAMLGLVGRHDFRVFMASDSSAKTTTGGWGVIEAPLKHTQY